MNIYSLPPLITAIISFLLGVFVLIKNKRSLTNFSFSLLCLATFGWQFSWVFLFNTTDLQLASIIAKIGYSVIIFIPITFYHFIAAYLEVDKKEKLFIYFSYSIGFIFLLILWSSYYFINGCYHYFYGFYPRASYLHSLHLLQLFVLTGRMVFLLAQSINKSKSSPIKYNQIKYLLLAILFYFPAAIDYCINYGLAVYPFGYIFVLLCLSIFSYSIVKYRLMDIKVAITRAGIFLFVYSFTLGFPFWFGYKTEAWTLAVTLMGILASVGPLIYHLLHVKAENILLAQQRHYQHILLQASAGMVKEHDLNRLLKVTTYIVKKVVKIKFAASFIEDTENSRYDLKVLRDSKRQFPGTNFSFNHPLIAFIRKTMEPFTFEELPDEIKASLNDFPLEVSMIIPSLIDDKLLGFLVLGKKLNNSLYTDDDIKVFTTLSNQAALAIENCKFMEEFRKTQERIFAAEKLASIGGLAEGVAHQIRNRLNHFSVTSGELQYEINDFARTHKELIEKNPDLKTTFDYLSEIGDSVLTNVKRTDGIINGILNYARVEAKESFFSQFFFSELFEPCIDLLKVKHKLQEFPLKVEISSTDIVWGIKSQLMEALYNILDNAYEAIHDKMEFSGIAVDKDFVPEIVFKLTQNPDFTFIEISDNGTGVKEEHKQKIFAPFFTTKSSYKSGMGIGMYVVKRMIEENHNGKVWFSSEYGVGTHFYIKLPKKKAEAAQQEEAQGGGSGQLKMPA